MKTIRLLSLIILLILSTNLYAANDEIISITNDWQSVPIRVDTEKRIYTIEGALPADNNNYYFSYGGYRCLIVKRDIEGFDAIVLHSSIIGGNDIYCYPE